MARPLSRILESEEGSFSPAFCADASLPDHAQTGTESPLGIIVRSRVRPSSRGPAQDGTGWSRAPGSGFCPWWCAVRSRFTVQPTGRESMRHSKELAWRGSGQPKIISVFGRHLPTPQFHVLKEQKASDANVHDGCNSTKYSLVPSNLRRWCAFSWIYAQVRILWVTAVGVRSRSRAVAAPSMWPDHICEHPVATLKLNSELCFLDNILKLRLWALREHPWILVKTSNSLTRLFGARFRLVCLFGRRPTLVTSCRTTSQRWASLHEISRNRITRL